MTSRLLSQIFDRNSASIYETFREQDAAMGSDSDLDDVEERSGLQQPIAGRAYVDEEESEMGDESTFQLRQRPAVPERQLRVFPDLSGRSRGYQFTQARYQNEEDNTDVPQSLLFESGGPSSRPRRQVFSDEDSVLEPSASITGDPGPSTMKNRRLEEQWNAATAPVDYDQGPTSKSRPPAPWSVSAKERALWKWANVENLDIFLQDVYVYYLGKGIYNIMLTRLLNLLFVDCPVLMS
jgi:autophagy-related protein 9